MAVDGYPVVVEYLVAEVFPGMRFVEFFGGRGRGRLVVDHHAVAGLAVETVEFVVYQRRAGPGVGNQKFLGDDAGLDRKVVVLAGHAAEFPFERMCQFAAYGLPIRRFAVTDKDHVPVTVVGFQYEVVRQPRVVEVDLFGRLPAGVEFVEHPSQPALLHILADAVLVGQLRPARSVRVEHHPEDFFVARAGIHEVGVGAESLSVAYPDQLFWIAVRIITHLQLLPFAQQERGFTVCHEREE